MEEHSTDFQNIDTAMVSPIISISNKEAIIFFVDYHNCHFKKYYKVAETVSIDEIKYIEVIIANELYRHFLGGANPNHCIPFPEDDPDSANQR